MNSALGERLARCATLPSLPAVALRVLELCRAADPNLDEVARVISSDAALSAKLLRMVNSPVFGLRQEVRTIRHAISMLGLISVRTLALSFSLAQGLRKNQKNAFKTYWKRSTLAAAAARELARALKRKDGEEAFLASLLQDIGVLALGQISSKKFENLAGKQDDHTAVVAHELAEFGCDHAAAGAWLATKWQLPATFAFAIEHSHDGDTVGGEAAPEIKALTALVIAAASIADIWVSPQPELATRAAQKRAEVLLGLESERFPEVLERVRNSADEVSKYLDIDIGSRAELNSILDQAKETLVMLTLHASQEASSAHETVSSLEARAKAAEAEASRDALTGIGNRGFLDRMLENEFRAARATGRELSVILIDLDHFKRVNDTWGHPVGDQVLKHVATLLGRGVRPRDGAGRYGGEEFMLILPDTNLPGARVVAERLRTRLADEPIGLVDGQSLRATASLGCAAFNLAEHATSAALVTAADRALYAAKESGRNRTMTTDDLESAPAQRLAR